MKKNKQYYRQCSFSRVDGESTIKTVGWVVERHKGKKIEVGLRVRFEDEDTWWTVDKVGDSRITYDAARMNERKGCVWKSETDY